MTPVKTQDSPGARTSGASFAAATSEAPPRTTDLATALASLPGGVVDGGEIVILAIKPSMWRPVFESVPWMIAWCVIAAVLTWLERPLLGLSITATAQIMLFIGFARLGVAVVKWVPAWYVLTNRRVIEIRGVRAPRISACVLIDVRNTYLNATASERLAKLGSITFVSEHSGHAAQIWQSITSPEQVHAEVRRAIENSIDQQGLSGSHRVR